MQDMLWQSRHSYTSCVARVTSQVVGVLCHGEHRTITMLIASRLRHPQALEKPGEFLLSDFAKLERSSLLHLGFQALDAFQASSRHPL